MLTPAGRMTFLADPGSMLGSDFALDLVIRAMPWDWSSHWIPTSRMRTVSCLGMEMLICCLVPKSKVIVVCDAYNEQRKHYQFL